MIKIKPKFIAALEFWSIVDGVHLCWKNIKMFKRQHLSVLHVAQRLADEAEGSSALSPLISPSDHVEES